MVRSKKLECIHCGRVFGMPAHLGRHLNAVHGAGKSARAGRKPGHRRGRRTALVALNGFGRVEQDLQRAREALAAQRAAIDSHIEKIEQVLEALS